MQSVHIWVKGVQCRCLSTSRWQSCWSTPAAGSAGAVVRQCCGFAPGSHPLPASPLLCARSPRASAGLHFSFKLHVGFVKLCLLSFAVAQEFLCKYRDVKNRQFLLLFSHDYEWPVWLHLAFEICLSDGPGFSYWKPCRSQSSNIAPVPSCNTPYLYRPHQSSAVFPNIHCLMWFLAMGFLVSLLKAVLDAYSWPEHIL